MPLSDGINLAYLYLETHLHLHLEMYALVGGSVISTCIVKILLLEFVILLPKFVPNCTVPLQAVALYCSLHIDMVMVRSSCSMFPSEIVYLLSYSVQVDFQVCQSKFQSIEVSPAQSRVQVLHLPTVQYKYSGKTENKRLFQASGTR